MSQSASATPSRSDATGTAMNILFSLSVAHMLNDTFQAMLPAIYPLLKDSYHLTFTQIGLITLTYQLTGSLLQPVVGFYTDRKPKPYSLPVGMGATLCGMALLSQAHTFPLMCLAAGLMGLGFVLGFVCLIAAFFTFAAARVEANSRPDSTLLTDKDIAMLRASMRKRPPTGTPPANPA